MLSIFVRNVKAGLFAISEIHYLRKQCTSNEVYRVIFLIGNTPGTLLGLSKVHKKNYPVGPILSALGIYNYTLAKFHVLLLQLFTNNQYTVKNSSSFVNEISTFPNQSYFMASFDVSSLFIIELYVDLLITAKLMNTRIVKLTVVIFVKFLVLL